MNQDFIDRRDWDGCEALYRKALEEIADPKWIKVAQFEKDVAEFIQSFRADIKPAFEKAFSVALKNDAVKAMHYNFEHGGDYGGESLLKLCYHYDSESDNWIGRRIKKGHPRFKLPEITVDVYSYVIDLIETGSVEAGLLMDFYLTSQIIMAVCKILEEIPNRNIPVAISRTTYKIVRFI